MKIPVSSLRFEIARSGKKSAFSLVEVVLAMGVFSFAFLSIIGLMASGLTSVKNASTSEAIANINRNLRASIQATPFTNFTSGTAVTSYYTASGFPTTASSTAPNTPFYTAVATTTASVYPGAQTSPNDFSLVVAISYPYPAKAQTITNSIFVAQ